MTVFATTDSQSGAPTVEACPRVQLLQAIVLPEPTADESATGPTTAPGTLIQRGRQGIDVCCGTGVLRITRLKLNRGKGAPLDAAAVINGYGEFFEVGGRLLSAIPESGDNGRG